TEPDLLGSQEVPWHKPSSLVPFGLKRPRSVNCAVRPVRPRSGRSIRQSAAAFSDCMIFRKLLDEHPSVTAVELSNYGEIFLNPELLEILALAHERKVVLTAGNGVNLNHV